MKLATVQHTTLESGSAIVGNILKTSLINWFRFRDQRSKLNVTSRQINWNVYGIKKKNTNLNSKRKYQLS